MAYIKEEFLGQFKFGQFSISFQGFANSQYGIIDFCNPIESKAEYEWNGKSMSDI